MALDRFTAYLRTAKTLTDIQYERVRGVVSPRPQLETTERQLETAETRGPSAQTKKTRLQLVFLSCAVCGIEFCYAAIDDTGILRPEVYSGLLHRYIPLKTKIKHKTQLNCQC